VSGGLSTYKKTQKEEKKKLHMCYILIIIINNIIIITGFINATCQGGCLHIKKKTKKEEEKKITNVLHFDYYCYYYFNFLSVRFVCQGIWCESIL
jgi:hypothetical protein